MRRRRVKLPTSSLALLLVCHACLLTVAQAATGDALQLPLASESLLLDVTHTGTGLVAVGERGHILLSDNAGKNWQQARVPTRQMLTAVTFVSPQRGWAVGHDGLILATIDGGQSWAIQRDGLAEQRHLNTSRLLDVRGLERKLQDALLAESEPARRKATQAQLASLLLDRQDLEYRLARPAFAPPLLDIYFADPLTGVAVGAFNTLLLTRNGGVSWESAGRRLANPEEYHLNGVVGDGAGRFWIAAEGGLLFRSGDAGVSWESLHSPYQASWFGIIRSPGTDVLLAYGLRGTVYRSTDQGDGWQRIETVGLGSIAGGSFFNDDYAVLVGGAGVVLTSDDGGASFTARTLEGRPGLSAVTCADGRIVAVGRGGVHVLSSLGTIQ